MGLFAQAGRGQDESRLSSRQLHTLREREKEHYFNKTKVLATFQS
jgi:hypothetical protein